MKQLENKYEKLYWKDLKHVCGIDEAGRGPIAGPLVVAGVVFECDYQNDQIYDSKGITEKKREELYSIILEDALYFQIEVITEEEIDKLNIYQATKCAMSKIATEISSDVIITDAMPLENINDKLVFSIIKGDQKSISIAAASILAKVTRDKIMKELDLKFPEYGFAKHKGYPTKQHLEALEKYGITEIHRKTYGPVALQNQMKLDI